MNITDKTILVTGASDGIGKSIAIQLAKHKANLVLFGRDAERLNTTKEACLHQGVQVATYSFDLTNDDERSQVAKEVLAAHTLDALVNNAGIWHNSSDLADLPAETIQAVITTNLTSQILLTKDLIDSMRSRETAIINIVSSAGMQAKAGRTAYAASKFGMRGFTDALREETKADPIRIGAVFQGGTNTQMFAKAGEDMPLAKYTDPADLADVVVFMLTRPSRLWITDIQVSY